MDTKSFNNTNIKLEVGPSCLISDCPKNYYPRTTPKNKKNNFALLMVIAFLLLLLLLKHSIKMNTILIGLLLLVVLEYCASLAEKTMQKIKVICGSIFIRSRSPDMVLTSQLRGKILPS